MRRTLSLIVLLTGTLSAFSSGSVVASSKPVHPPAHKTTPPKLKLPPGWPKSVTVSSIGINAPVESLALTRAADVHAPYKWGDVAWYNRGPRPGELGRATMFGHLDSTCCPAIFYRLRDLRSGAIVQVSYKKGALKFKVQWVTTYPNNKLPVKFLFGPANERGVALVTCTGVYHRGSIGYDHRLVAYARLLLPNGKLG